MPSLLSAFDKQNSTLKYLRELAVQSVDGKWGDRCCLPKDVPNSDSLTSQSTPVIRANALSF